MQNSFAKKLDKAKKKYDKKRNAKSRKQWFKLLSHALLIREPSKAGSMSGCATEHDRQRAFVPPDVLEEIMKYPDSYPNLTSLVMSLLVKIVSEKRLENDDAGWIYMLKMRYDVFFMRVINIRQLKPQFHGLAIQLLSIFAWKFRSILRKSKLWQKTLYKIYNLLPEFAKRQKVYSTFMVTHLGNSCARDVDLYQMYYLLSGVSILFLSDFITSDNEAEVICILTQGKSFMPENYFEEVCENAVDEGHGRVDQSEFRRIVHMLVLKHTSDLQQKFLDVFPEASPLFEAFHRTKRFGLLHRHVQCDQCKMKIFKKQCKRCSVCSVGWYCSKKCQKAAWTKHKKVCQSIDR